MKAQFFGRTVGQHRVPQPLLRVLVVIVAIIVRHTGSGEESREVALVQSKRNGPTRARESSRPGLTRRGIWVSWIEGDDPSSGRRRCEPPL